MHNERKFNFENGVIEEELIEDWVESYFSRLMNLFNGFFAKVEAAEAVSRISVIPFEKLILEELAEEDPEVKKIALAKLKELVETELEIMKSYLEII